MSIKLTFVTSILCLILASTNASAQPFTKLFPTSGAKDVCPDTPLRIEFPSAPVVGAGKSKSPTPPITPSSPPSTSPRPPPPKPSAAFPITSIIPSSSPATKPPSISPVMRDVQQNLLCQNRPRRLQRCPRHHGCFNAWTFSTKSAPPKSGTPNSPSPPTAPAISPPSRPPSTSSPTPTPRPPPSSSATEPITKSSA